MHIYVPESTRIPYKILGPQLNYILWVYQLKFPSVEKLAIFLFGYQYQSTLLLGLKPGVRTMVVMKI